MKHRTLRVCRAAFVGALLSWLLPSAVLAEPYLAVESGLKCGSCHVNPAGGGKRTEFGTLYARNQIAANVWASGAVTKPWTGDVKSRLAVGADVRGGYASVDIDGQGSQSDTDLSRATVYALLRAVPNLLSFYFDEKIAPDDTENREAYLLLTPKLGKYVIKAGQMFLPFGLRLQDDNTFVRQSSGINFLTPEDGVELGLELPKWTAQLAVTKPDGTRRSSTDHVSASAAYVQPRWRVGASYNTNEDPFGTRDMLGVFGGLKTGPIAWLAEIDLVSDDARSASRDGYATLLEGNWRFRKGHNLKVGYEFYDPDRDRGEDQQERYSVVYEYSPIQFVQARAGARHYNGIPNFPITNRDEVFAELHVYF